MLNKSLRNIELCSSLLFPTKTFHHTFSNFTPTPSRTSLPLTSTPCPPNSLDVRRWRAPSGSMRTLLRRLDGPDLFLSSFFRFLRYLIPCFDRLLPYFFLLRKVFLPYLFLFRKASRSRSSSLEEYPSPQVGFLELFQDTRHPVHIIIIDKSILSDQKSFCNILGTL